MTSAPPTETPDPLVTGIALDEQVISNWVATAQDWITNHLLSVNTAIQFALILCAFIAGALIERIVLPYVTAMIEALKIKGAVRAILHNIRRLIGPFFALMILFILLIVIPSLGMDMNVTFMDVAMRLTAAWIIIRLAVQLVKNPFARNMIAAIVWTIAALSIFGVLDDTAAALDGVGITIRDYRLTALIMVKCLLATMLLMYGAGALSRFVDKQLGRVPNMSSGSRTLITKITRMLLMVVAVMIGITMAGVDLSVLAVFSGAIGLGVGFGLQRGVSNLFTGIMLLLDRTVQPGDILELQGGTFGVVRQMGSRCTEIVTLDQRAFLIPNEDLVTKPVINWSRGGANSVLSVKFRVDYRHSPHDVIRIATEAAAGHPRVLKTPAPGCALDGFGDSGMDFSVGFWIADPQNGTGNVQSDVRLALWDAFQKNKIIIPYPHQVAIQSQE